MKAHRRPVSGCGSQRMLHALERRSHPADHGSSFASLYSPFVAMRHLPRPGKSLLAGGGQLCCNSRTGQIKNPRANAAAATTLDIPTGWDLQQRRPRPVADAGEELLGQRPAKRTCRPRHARMLGAATRGTKQQPTGLIAYLLRRAVLFDSCTGQIKNPRANAAAATTLDIPTGWDPNTKKSPLGSFFAACGRPCSFDSSYGLHETATTLDIPGRWDPRTKQQPTGLIAYPAAQGRAVRFPCGSN